MQSSSPSDVSYFMIKDLYFLEKSGLRAQMNFGFDGSLPRKNSSSGTQTLRRKKSINKTKKLDLKGSANIVLSTDYIVNIKLSIFCPMFLDSELIENCDTLQKFVQKIQVCLKVPWLTITNCFYNLS